LLVYEGAEHAEDADAGDESMRTWWRRYCICFWNVLVCDDSMRTWWMTVYSICVLNVLVWIGVLNMSNECGMKECDRQTKEACIRDRA
jgi:hypothetical protein